MTTPEEQRTLVAEEVMGWRTDVWHGWECWFMPEVSEKSQRIRKENFNPLESWADTGRVIERMEELGWIWRIHKYKNGWVDVLFEEKDGGSYPHGYAKDENGKTREAICVAALRALGVEVE